jgi:hypothetical protein
MVMFSFDGFRRSQAVEGRDSHESSLVAYETQRGLRQTVRFHLTNRFSDEPAGLRQPDYVLTDFTGGNS